MDLERYLGRYAATLVLSYNPNRYEQLITLRTREIARFFLLTLLWGLVIFTLIFLLVSVRYINSLPEKLDKVEEFSLDGEFAATAPVELIEDPKVILDLSGEHTGHDVLLTAEGVEYPRYIFFGKTFVPWESLRDLKNPTVERDALLKGIVIFLVPSVLFWFFLLSAIQLAFVFLILIAAGYYVPRSFKHGIPFKNVLKTGLLAMPSVTLIGVGLYPIGPELFWWGALLTAIVFGLGIFTLSERRVKHK